MLDKETFLKFVFLTNMKKDLVIHFISVIFLVLLYIFETIFFPTINIFNSLILVNFAMFIVFGNLLRYTTMVHGIPSREKIEKSLQILKNSIRNETERTQLTRINNLMKSIINKKISFDPGVEALKDEMEKLIYENNELKDTYCIKTLERCLN